LPDFICITYKDRSLGRKPCALETSIFCRCVVNIVVYIIGELFAHSSVSSCRRRRVKMIGVLLNIYETLNIYE